MPSTGYFTHPAYLRHDTGPGHPERAARLAAIDERLRAGGIGSELARAEAPLADPAALATVHDPAYVERVEARIERGERVLDEGDTRVSAESWRAARAAAGGAIAAVDRVMSGELANAFVGARPPGHHAERSHAMGFCLFNNAAIAAQHARIAHGIQRVAIVDWDVHHGNGTQHLFERDPSVYYASIHQWPLYPGTGLEKERGIGAGEGTTLNVPMPPGTDDAAWLSAFESKIVRALEDFAPELVILSAGFDAHAADPLSQTRLSTDAYRTMTEACIAIANATARGRMVSLLEGGYDLDALSRSVEAHLIALARAARPS